MWGEDQEKCFQNTKKELLSAPILASFDSRAITYLTVDVSATGLGVVLSQVQEGKHKTIAFASRTLTVTERNYSVSEREAFTAEWAFEYFRWCVCVGA